MRLAHTTFAAALALASASPANASDVPTALALEAEGRLGDAMEAFEAALASPGNSREDLATIYLHLGTLRFAYGEADAAREAFHRLYAVDPEPTLPESAPPEVQELLGQVASVWGGRRLRASIDAPETAAAGEPLEVRAHVQNDVAGMVAGATLAVDGIVAAEAQGPGPFDLDVAAGALDAGESRLAVRLLDEHGGTVWQSEPMVVTVTGPEGGEGGTAGDEPGEEPGEPGEPGAQQGSGVRAMRAAGWALLSVGVVATGVGGALAGIDGSATGATREIDGVVEDEVYATGVGGWVAIGVGAAAIVTAVVLLALPASRGSDDAEAVADLAGGRLFRW